MNIIRKSSKRSSKNERTRTSSGSHHMLDSDLKIDIDSINDLGRNMRRINLNKSIKDLKNISVRSSKTIRKKFYSWILIPIAIVIFSNVLFYLLINFTNFPDLLIVIIHIIMTSGGLLSYFLILFQRNHLSKKELIFMMFIVYIMTIGIFANYYYMPCSNSSECMRIDGVPSNLTYFDSIYFSAGTMTSAGTGDIVAKSVFDRSLVMVEMIAGPLYMGLIMYYLTRED